MVAGLLVAGTGAASASASSGWSRPVADGVDSYSVSCPSAAFCADAGKFFGKGATATYTDGAWSKATITTTDGTMGSVSCPSAAFCIAVGNTGAAGTDGDAVTYTHGAWSKPAVIDPDSGLDSVSCPSAAFCVAVGGLVAGASDTDGNAVTYTDGAWSQPVSIDSGNGLDSVSCPSAAFCVAVDQAGDALTYTDGTWSQPVSTPAAGLGSLNSVSCPSAAFCVAVSGRDAITYADGAWSQPASIDPSDNLFDPGLQSVSCPSAAFCVAVDLPGNALTYTDGAWSQPVSTPAARFGSLFSLNSVSCPSAAFCAAVSPVGYAITYPASAPHAAKSKSCPPPPGAGKLKDKVTDMDDAMFDSLTSGGPLGGVYARISAAADCTDPIQSSPTSSWVMLQTPDDSTFVQAGLFYSDPGDHAFVEPLFRLCPTGTSAGKDTNCLPALRPYADPAVKGRPSRFRVDGNGTVEFTQHLTHGTFGVFAVGPWRKAPVNCKGYPAKADGESLVGMGGPSKKHPAEQIETTLNGRCLWYYYVPLSAAAHLTWADLAAEIHSTWSRIPGTQASPLVFSDAHVYYDGGWQDFVKPLDTYDVSFHVDLSQLKKSDPVACNNLGNIVRGPSFTFAVWSKDSAGSCGP
jgi:hypothetical protein